MAQAEGRKGRTRLRVLFWGTPDFALPTARAVADAGHRLVGVVTRPDRPRGRGRRVRPSPVRRVADERGWPVLAPERPGGDPFRREVRALAPDISVVVAYGRILPEPVLDLPRLGSLNLHASLLPALRGAAPVHWAIARGHAETGVTVMRMARAMDAGPVVAQARTPVGAEETSSELSRRLSGMGAQLVVDVLARMEAGPVPEVEQDHEAATYAPRVGRAAARVDWGADAREVANLIRAMDAKPGAWTRRGEERIKLFRPTTGGRTADPSDAGPSADPGRVVAADSRSGLLVAAGAGVVRIGEVQPAGKRRMPAAAWLRGRGARAGERFA